MICFSVKLLSYFEQLCSYLKFSIIINVSQLSLCHQGQIVFQAAASVRFKNPAQEESVL